MEKKISCLLFSLFLIAGPQCQGQPARNKLIHSAARNKVIHSIDFNWLECCETGKGDCNPVILTRQQIIDSVRLIFPSGGTSSSVYLYKTRDIDSASLSKPLLKDDKRAGQGLPSLDLTGLPDGNYFARMMSCGVGGGFPVIVQTR